MPQNSTDLITIDTPLLLEAQRQLNAVFAADMLFPVYVIKSPDIVPDCVMGVSGGRTSLYYRDIIHDWQGAGFVIEVHQDEMTPSDFYGGLLHVLGHTFQPNLMSPPCSSMPEEIGLFPVRLESMKPVSDIGYDYFSAHKTDFWRIAIHTWARGVNNGFPCNPQSLGPIWVSHDTMHETLKPEIAALSDMPLWKVALRPVPVKFERLFDFDPHNPDDVKKIKAMFETAK